MGNSLPADAAVKLKAVRFALIQLENGLNAADHELLWSLFAASAVVITPTAKVIGYPSSRLPLPYLLSGEVDALLACTITLLDVVLLSQTIAWSDMGLRLRLSYNNTVAESSDRYLAVLEQSALTAKWVIVLLQQC